MPQAHTSDMRNESAEEKPLHPRQRRLNRRQSAGKNEEDEEAYEENREKRLAARTLNGFAPNGSAVSIPAIPVSRFCMALASNGGNSISGSDYA